MTPGGRRARLAAPMDSGPELHKHCHERVEVLADALARFLASRPARDPFVTMPIVVGSRSVERWLRAELATRAGVAANLAFPGPRAALRGAVRALLRAPGTVERRFWEESPGAAWTAPWLTPRVAAILRRRRDEEAFREVRTAVRPEGEPMDAREHGFLREVAACVERLVAERAKEVRDVLEAPTEKHPWRAWLGVLVRELLSGDHEPTPGEYLAQLATRGAAPLEVPLILFGLSTPSAHDREHLEAIGAFTPVHLFALTPTRIWRGDEPARHALLARAKHAATVEDREAATRELDEQNPVLAADGALARGFQVWLERIDARDALAELPEPMERAPLSTLLGALQHSLLEAESLARRTEAPPWAHLASCDSLAFHGCHTALGECEALRDALLDAFVRDPSLEPRHILVTTPDITLYGPLIQAVFGRPLPARRRGLPVQVADASLREANPFASALLQLLALAGGRVTASALLEFLALAPVRLKFGLSETARPELEALVHEGGLRWGWDAADREKHGQPRARSHTVAFALERLALGVLMDGDAPLGTGGDERSGDLCLGSIAPVPLRTREREELFGKLAAACAAVRASCERVTEPRAASEWTEVLESALDALTEAETERFFLRMHLTETLEGLLGGQTTTAQSPSDVASAPAPLPLARDAVLALLTGCFDLPAAVGGASTNAVTVSGLMPMRAVPFRIVAAIGLAEKVFPRASHEPAWSPFARRLPGESSRTQEDRNLFLELIHCARQKLWLFATAFDGRGAPKPVSAVVHELLGAVAHQTGKAASHAICNHPLQPWSTGPRRQATFDRVWSESHARLGAGNAGSSYAPVGLALARPAHARPFNEARAARPTARPRVPLLAPQLARLLENGPRAYVRGGLGIELEDFRPHAEDREPIDSDDLVEGPLRRQMLAALRADDLETVDFSSAEARIVRDLVAVGHASGALPTTGRATVDVSDRVLKLRAAHGIALANGAPSRVERGRNVTLEHAPGIGVDAAASVRGVVPFVVEWPQATGEPERVFVWLFPCRPYDDGVLEAWIVTLTALASGERVTRAILAAPSEKDTVRFAALPEADEARELLAKLMREAADSERRVAPRIPNLSRRLAEAIAAGSTARAALETALRTVAWDSSPFGRAVLDDPFVRAIFGDWSTDDLSETAEALASAATDVWSPIARAYGAAPAKPRRAASRSR